MKTRFTAARNQIFHASLISTIANSPWLWHRNAPIEVILC